MNISFHCCSLTKYILNYSEKKKITYIAIATKVNQLILSNKQTFCNRNIVNVDRLGLIRWQEVTPVITSNLS